MGVKWTVPIGGGPVARRRCAPGGAGGHEELPSGLRSPWVDWQAAVLPSKIAARELLDLLEARGISEREFSALGESEFEVRWR